MKIKNLILLVSSVVLILSLSVGGTMAWLTATRSVTNTFTVGDIDMKLEEPSWTESESHVIVPGKR